MTREEEFLRRMREVQAAREEAIEPLAAVMAERRRLKDLLAETDVAYGTAYAAAEAAGWRPDELERLGAEAPARRPKGRPRKRAEAVRRSGIPGPSAADAGDSVPSSAAAAS